MCSLSIRGPDLLLVVMSKCVFLANLLLILEVSGAKSIWRPLRELLFQMYNGNRVLVDFIEEERLAMTVST